MAGQGTQLAVILTGDGGWAGLDKGVASALAAEGIPVIGWDSLRYYWTARTPETAAADLARILRHYQSSWHRERFILVGYSFGAEVLPFLVSRLPAELQQRIDRVALLAPGTHAQFEFKLSDWLGGSEQGADVRSEVDRLKIGKILCMYGATEKNSLCPTLNPTMALPVELPGGHHFDVEYEALVRRLLNPSGTDAIRR